MSSYVCIDGGETRGAEDFYPMRRRGRVDRQRRCRFCTKKSVKKWRAENPEKLWAIKYRHQLKRKYGITLDDYDTMFAEQDGCCAICGNDDPGWKHSKRFIVDHDHTTGKVRALLCYPCNTAIGHFKDDVDLMTRAIAYIERHRA